MIFFDRGIKKPLAEALVEINSQLKKLHQEGDYMRRAIQRTQSDNNKLRYEQRILKDYIKLLEQTFHSLEDRIYNLENIPVHTAITADHRRCVQSQYRDPRGRFAKQR